MSKLTEKKVYQDDHDRRFAQAVADVVFGMLCVSRYIKFEDNAEDVLAAHMNINVEDVHKWFRGEALSS